MVKLDFHAPATYRIRIKGYREGSWSDRLGGMDMKWTESAQSALILWGNGGPGRRDAPTMATFQDAG
jgi:hypothetical protein